MAAEASVDNEIPTTLDAEFYYSKAMGYLADNQSGADSCACSHCPDPEAEEEEEAGDKFAALSFRPGLTLDEDLLRGPSFRRKSEGAGVGFASSSPPPAASAQDRLRANSEPRQRKVSIGGRGYREVLSKSQIKRKLSDGHVHWADEFQKDLTRSHPRKTYTRHPSITHPPVKPILKANLCDEDCEGGQDGED